MGVLECTITIFRDHDKVLLGLKRPERRFGGKWNGPGGKLEPGESVLDALIRESVDECGLIPTEYEQKQIIDFRYRDDPLVVRCYVFEVTKYTGVLKAESREFAKFQWYEPAKIPYRESDDGYGMLEADAIWLPQLLAGERIESEFLYEHPDRMALVSPKSS